MQAMLCTQDALMQINTVNLIIRLMIIASCLVAIISFYLWGIRTERKLEAGVAILWLFNVMAFHLARMFCINYSAEFYNNWSLGIHLHAALGCAIAGAWLAKTRKL